MSAKRRTGSKLKTGFLLLMIPVGFVLIVNLFWFRYSTTRVSIPGPGLADVKILVDSDVIELGDLRRGESRFMFLPNDGPATYSITFLADNYTRTACEVDIEGTKNHVEATLYSGRESICEVTEPLFTDLMIAKFF